MPLERILPNDNLLYSLFINKKKMGLLSDVGFIKANYLVISVKVGSTNCAIHSKTVHFGAFWYVGARKSANFQQIFGLDLWQNHVFV